MTYTNINSSVTSQSTNEGSIGLLITRYGVTGFAVSASEFSPEITEAIENLSCEIGQSAKWMPNKKMWAIPLGVAGLINSDDARIKALIGKVFGSFPVTEAAKSVIDQVQAA